MEGIFIIRFGETIFSLLITFVNMISSSLTKPDLTGFITTSFLLQSMKSITSFGLLEITVFGTLKPIFLATLSCVLLFSAYLILDGLLTQKQSRFSMNPRKACSDSRIANCFRLSSALSIDGLGKDGRL